MELIDAEVAEAEKEATAEAKRQVEKRKPDVKTPPRRSA